MKRLQALSWRQNPAHLRNWRFAPVGRRIDNFSQPFAISLRARLSLDIQVFFLELL